MWHVFILNYLIKLRPFDSQNLDFKKKLFFSVWLKKVRNKLENGSSYLPFIDYILIKYINFIQKTLRIYFLIFYSYTKKILEWKQKYIFVTKTKNKKIFLIIFPTFLTLVEKLDRN